MRLRTRYIQPEPLPLRETYRNPITNIRARLVERRAASFRLFGNQFRCFRLHPWSLGALVPASLHFKHQTFEILRLRQVEDNGMV